jgi:hypothetical protein
VHNLLVSLSLGLLFYGTLDTFCFLLLDIRMTFESLDFLANVDDFLLGKSVFRLCEAYFSLIGTALVAYGGQNEGLTLYGTTI